MSISKYTLTYTCAPGRPWAVAAGSLPRATRSAPKAGALHARALTCAPRVTAHVVSWGGVGMSKKSCAARCSRGSVQGVLRARPAEGGGGVAHREDLAATASATLERSTGTVAHGQERAARERRRRRSIEVSRITTYLYSPSRLRPVEDCQSALRLRVRP